MSDLPVRSTARESLIQTWMNALTKPREETYAAIAASPRAKAMTGYLWVFVASIVSTIATFIAQGAQMRRAFENSDVSVGQLGTPGGFLVALLCSAPFLALFGAVGFAIWTALTQWVARMFGGTGTNEKLAYTLAAIAAPFSLVSAALVLLAAVPYVGLCINAVLFLAGLYAIFLDVTAIKAVNHFGWGPAIGAYFIPGLALLLIICCAVFAIFSVLGLALGDVWSTINLSSIQMQ